MQNPEYRAPRTDAERTQFSRSCVLAFIPDDPQRMAWYESHVGSNDDQRVLVEGADVLATAALYRFAHWFGARSVPAVGVGLVSVPPEHRGSGAASRIMEEIVREAHREGYPISTLYPATVPLYRRSGYELAGARYVYEFPPRVASVPSQPGSNAERSTTIRRADESDRETVRAIYARTAPAQDGFVDRNDQMWARIFDSKDGPSEIAIVEQTGPDTTTRPTGSLVYSLRTRFGPSGRVEVFDASFETPEAGREILRFLSRFGTTQRHIIIDGGVVPPLLMLLPDHDVRCTLVERWMLRVVDVEKALTARGYPPGLTTEVAFEVSDDLIDANNGAFTLRVDNGSASVERGGSPSPPIRLDIRALAAMYTGYLSPRHLARCGMADASDSSLEAAASLFAGPSPAMSEEF